MPNNHPPFILQSMDMLREILILEDKTDIQTNPDLGLPFRVDHKTYAPQDVHLFDQRLCFYLNDILIEAKQIRAFACKADLRRYLMDTEQLSCYLEHGLENELQHQAPIPPESSAKGFALRDYSGHCIDFPVRHALTDIPGSFYSNTSYQNFSIRSISSNYCTLACFSQPNFTGNMLVIARHTHIADVRAYWPIEIVSVVEIGC